jgi:hypothetical protein
MAPPDAEVGMRAAAGPLLLVAALLGCSFGCHSSGGTTPAPSPPVVPSPQPPDLDISGQWSGPESDSDGPGTVTFDLQQDGGTVTGNGTVAEDKVRAGLLAGTLSASTLYFTFNYGGNCVRMLHGTMTVGVNTMTGTFSGSNACVGTISSGQISLTWARPDLRGVWSGPAPSVLGPGTWTWQIQQDGFDRITAAVSVATDLFHETDTLSGALTLAEGNYTLAGTFPLSGCSGVTASVTPGTGAPPVTASQINGVLTVSNASCTGGLSGTFVLNKQ